MKLNSQYGNLAWFVQITLGISQFFKLFTALYTMPGGISHELSVRLSVCQTRDL